MKSGKLFSNNLKSLRLSKGFSLRQMSPVVKIHYVTLSRMENGHAAPSHDQLDRICRVYGVKATDLYRE